MKKTSLTLAMSMAISAAILSSCGGGSSSSESTTASAAASAAASVEASAENIQDVSISQSSDTSNAGDTGNKDAASEAGQNGSANGESPASPASSGDTNTAEADTIEASSEFATDTVEAANAESPANEANINTGEGSGTGGDAGAVASNAIQGAIEVSSSPGSAAIFDSLASSVALPEMIGMNDQFISNYLGMDLGQVESFVFQISENPVSADSVIIMKAKDASVIPTLTDALTVYQESKKAELKNYAPEGFEVANAGTIKTKGNYVYLVMLKNADEVNKAIEAAIGK